MNTASLAGIFRALAGPLVAALGRVGIDITWLMDPEIAGLIVGLICAIFSVRAKKALQTKLESPPDQPNP